METTTKPPITQVRLDNDTHHALKQLAVKYKMTMGGMVKRMIELWEKVEKE